MKITEAELRKVINEEFLSILEAKVIDFPGGKKGSGSSSDDGEGEPEGEGEVVPFIQPKPPGREAPGVIGSEESIGYAAFGVTIGFLSAKMPRKDLTIEEIMTNPVILEKLVLAINSNNDEFLKDWRFNKNFRSKYLGEPESESEPEPTRVPAISIAKDLTARDRADDTLRDPGTGTYKEVGVEIPERIRKIAHLNSDGVAARDLRGLRLEKVKKEIRTALSKLPNGGKGSSVYSEIKEALKADRISKYDVYDLTTALQEMAVELLDKD